LIFADAFSKFFLRRSDIENVVDDLEGEAQGLTESGEVAEFCGMDSYRHGSETQRGGNQGAGLGTVDFDEFFERDALFFRIEIKDLAGDQAEAT
jgi:hypothetical protein